MHIDEKHLDFQVPNLTIALSYESSEVKESSIGHDQIFEKFILFSWYFKTDFLAHKVRITYWINLSVLTARKVVRVPY